MMPSEEKRFDFKPLETIYGGCRFRSRLEARWAVFLDVIKEPWEYETAGFKLSSGECYLPDFWLPRMNVWLEVKGTFPTEAEFSKAIHLAGDRGSPVLLFWGQPTERVGLLVGGWLDDGWDHIYRKVLPCVLCTTLDRTQSLALEIERPGGEGEVFSDSGLNLPIPQGEQFSFVSYAADVSRLARFPVASLDDLKQLADTDAGDQIHQPCARIRHSYANC